MLTRALNSDIIPVRHKKHIAVTKRAIRKSGRPFITKDLPILPPDDRALIAETENKGAVAIISASPEASWPPDQDFRIAKEDVFYRVVPERIYAAETGSGIVIEKRTGFLGWRKTYFMTNRHAFNMLYRCAR